MGASPLNSWVPDPLSETDGASQTVQNFALCSGREAVLQGVDYVTISPMLTASLDPKRAFDRSPAELSTIGRIKYSKYRRLAVAILHRQEMLFKKPGSRWASLS